MKQTIAFPRFDAELDTDVCDAHNNMNLTLTLRLGFTQINPTGGAASGTYHDYGDPTEPSRRIVRWTDGTWAAWKSNFVSTAQSFWNGKFWLINSTSLFSFAEGGHTYIPNAYCRLRIVAQAGTAANNHHTIQVVRLHSSENWFGSHSTLYDSLDTRSVQKETNDDGTPIMQRAHVHEVGHLLGLGHVAIGQAGCPSSGNTNIAACYGTTDVDQNSVMGSGMQLRNEHALPWQTAMQGHSFREATRTAGSGIMGMLSGVQAGLATWTPKRSRHYPRTPAEVQSGTLVTTRRSVTA